jgi:hypothetical protein
MRKLLFILPIVLLLSCQSNTVKLVGHWHNIDYDSASKFRTVDFIDSITIINDWLDIMVACEGKYHLSNDTIYSYSCGQPDFVNYSFNEDTLLLNNDRFVKFMKNSKACSDIFFSILKLKVQLSEEINTMPINFVSDICGNMSFGKLRKQNVSEKDTFYLQINRHLREISDINVYLEAMEEAYEDEDIQRSIMLTIDKNTPKWMIDSTINMIRRHEIIDKIYKTCINKETGSIGLVKINN